MKHKLGICIPYRNRFEHLQQLTSKLGEFLDKKGIDHKFYVAHQVDDKLFNRGLMKNIAAKYAFDDGCDYIAWHDVDMIPLEEGCDYSYPGDFPVHIATKLSKYDFKLNYEQYFGGVILFTKEQVLKTNGYSNNYWDWGMEDDDLFYRCHFEGYSNCRVYKKYRKRKFARFNGDDSYVEIPWIKSLNRLLGSDHTICVLFNPEQQQEKYKDWLIGTEDKKFIEFPVFRKQSYSPYCISFNNSRAVTSMLFDGDGGQVYNWIKREDSVWSWVTTSYNSSNNRFSFFLNDELGRYNEKGTKENRSVLIKEELFQYNDKSPSFVGCNDDPGNPIFFRGEIAELMIFDQAVKDPKDVSKFHDGKKKPIMHFKFNSINGGQVQDIIGGVGARAYNLEIVEKAINVTDMPIPHRREGSFECLPHIDEGLVNNKWAKGETTARNERILVTEMQRRSLDYKSDGINSMKYELITTKDLGNNVLLINCKAYKND